MTAESTDPMAMATSCLEGILQKMKAYYLMTWKGSKVPHGATIGGEPISCIQHGRIYSDFSQELGYYTRMAEWSGKEKDEHMIIVALSEAAEVLAPDGSVCEPIPMPAD